jgi:hypothetical protein
MLVALLGWFRELSDPSTFQSSRCIGLSVRPFARMGVARA